MNEAQHIIINLDLFFKFVDLHTVQILVTVSLCCPFCLPPSPTATLPPPSSTPPFVSPSYLWPAGFNVKGIVYCGMAGMNMEGGYLQHHYHEHGRAHIYYSMVSKSMGQGLSTAV